MGEESGAKRSITTKRGDGGETDLLFGQRVAKDHPRLAAVGAVDEMMAALGLVRQHAKNANTSALAERVQRDLIGLMGVLSTAAEDYPRYLRSGFATVEEHHVSQLTRAAEEIEAIVPPVSDWVLPGAVPSLAAAHLEVARTICRRAERCVAALRGDAAAATPHALTYLNRLADLLWLLARLEERSA